MVSAKRTNGVIGVSGKLASSVACEWRVGVHVNYAPSAVFNNYNLQRRVPSLTFLGRKVYETADSGTSVKMTGLLRMFTHSFTPLFYSLFYSYSFTHSFTHIVWLSTEKSNGGSSSWKNHWAMSVVNVGRLALSLPPSLLSHPACLITWRAQTLLISSTTRNRALETFKSGSSNSWLLLWFHSTHTISPTPLHAPLSSTCY